MSADELAGTLRQALIALGALFVIVNLRVSYQLAAWWRLRRDVVLTWPSPKPPFFAINLAIGVMLGAILLLTAYRMPRSYSSLFGVAMMFTYYGYLLPLSARIKPGLYRDGIWTDSGFMEERWHVDPGIAAKDAGPAVDGPGPPSRRSAAPAARRDWPPHHRVR